MAILEIAEESGNCQVIKVGLTEKNEGSELFLKVKEGNLKITVEEIIWEM